jgi:hypothetical protein
MSVVSFCACNPAYRDELSKYHATEIRHYERHGVKRQ